MIVSSNVKKETAITRIIVFDILSANSSVQRNQSTSAFLK